MDKIIAYGLVSAIPLAFVSSAIYGAISPLDASVVNSPQYPVKPKHVGCFGEFTQAGIGMTKSISEIPMCLMFLPFLVGMDIIDASWRTIIVPYDSIRHMRHRLAYDARIKEEAAATAAKDDLK